MKIYRVALLLLLAFFLQGCVGVAVLGVGAIATKTAIDPRTTGEQIDDTTLNSRVNMALRKEMNVNNGARIESTAYVGSVLLTGQAVNQAIIDKAQSIVRSVDGVKNIYNQVRLGQPVGLSTVSNDTWITTKVRSQLLTDDGIKARNLKVVTENGEVFLLGIVTREEGKKASALVSKVSGVRAVNTIYTYLD